jgi:hypothetical protein
MAAMSIFFICIIASKARLAAAASGPVTASVRAIGVVPFVLAPTAGAFLAAVADDGVPVAVRFGLVNGCDLKRERFVVLERGSAIETDAGNAHQVEFDRQRVPFLPRRKVSRCAVHRAYG